MNKNTLEVYEWPQVPRADFAVIGDPIKHSLSPRMHQAAYEALGMEYRYIAIRVPTREVSSALEALRNNGVRGVNVTVPHKEEATHWCLDLSPEARLLRATNTILMAERRGLNTDLGGLLAVFDRERIPKSGIGLVLGAGGSARSAAVAMHRHGLRVRCWNRTASRVDEMAQSLRIPIEAVESPDARDCSLVLNATAASMQDQSLDVNWSETLPDSVAMDLYYGREMTPFLKEASIQGCRAIDGKSLLVEQGALALEAWLHVTAPREAMYRAVTS